MNTMTASGFYAPPLQAERPHSAGAHPLAFVFGIVMLAAGFIAGLGFDVQRLRAQPAAVEPAAIATTKTVGASAPTTVSVEDAAYVYVAEERDENGAAPPSPEPAARRAPLDPTKLFEKALLP